MCLRNSPIATIVWWKSSLTASMGVMGILHAQSEAEDPAPDPLAEILNGSTFLERIASEPKHEVQILYTQIDRNAENRRVFQSFSWQLDPSRYFYPASTVKLPAAILALEKIQANPLLERDSRMLTEPLTAVGDLRKAAENSVERHIREIFLFSDNAAYNRLFELVGPEALTQGLLDRGYRGVRIFHRLETGRMPGEIILNPIRFLSPPGDELQRLPERRFENRYRAPAPIRKGRAHWSKGKLIEEPMDFASSNAFPLEAQQRTLRALVFPDSIPEAQRFRLEDENRRYLLREMALWVSEPGQADDRRKNEKISDSYTKMLFYGTEQPAKEDPEVRSFGKSGMAYGWLTDNAYLVDFKSGVEFFLSATIHVCANDTYNDDVYEYDTIGLPFLKELGRAVYFHELERTRPRAVDFNHLPTFSKE